MDSNYASVGAQLKEQLAMQFDAPKEHLDGKAEHPNPSLGFETTEAPPAPEPAQPDKTEAPSSPSVSDFDTRMAKVMSQAQKVQQERQAFAAEQAKFKADLEELARFRDLKARAKEDPVSVAETFGYKPDEYATVLMEKGSLTPDRRKILEQSQEIQELKGWRQKQEEAAQAAQQQQLYQNSRSMLEQFAATNAEKYDLIHRTGAYDRVLHHIQNHWNQTSALGEPEIMPFEQAFDLAEQELEQYYTPVLESPKIRSKLISAAAPSNAPPDRKPIGISNKLRAQSAPPKELTEAERLQKAGEFLFSQIHGRRG
jgi:hypothetical protein